MKKILLSMLLVLGLSFPGRAFPCGPVGALFRPGEEILVKYRGKWSLGLILGEQDKFFLVELKNVKKTNLWVTRKQMKLTPEAEKKLTAC